MDGYNINVKEEELGMTTLKLELRTLQFQNQPLPTERKG